MGDNNIILEEDISCLILGLKGGICTMKTNSMTPAIKQGWKAKVIPIEPARLKIGDIVVFYRNNLVCHRLIGIFRKKNGGFLFWEKGDANSNFRILDDKDVLGKVIEVRDKNNNIVNPKYWEKCNLYDSVFIFLHKKLVVFRRIIFKEKKNLITHLAGTLFWKVYFKLGQRI